MASLMELTEDANPLSLRRLQQLEKLAQQEAPHGLAWNWLKSDNLFLIILVCALICLCFLVALLFHRQNHRHQEFRQFEQLQAARAAQLHTKEIPLGEFESVVPVPEQAGTVSVLKYEAYITTDSSLSRYHETETLVTKRWHKLRSTVEAAMNQAPRESLREPSLDAVRQQLVQKLNEVVGERRVQDVQFASFLHFRIAHTH